MKKCALALLFIFVCFVVTPTIIMILDKSADVSMAFTDSEEESSTKNEVSFEYHLEHFGNADFSTYSLPEESLIAQFFKRGYRSVFPEVISPPPRLA